MGSVKNGVTWNRHLFPDQTIIEIRPEEPINKSDILLMGLVESWFDFGAERIAELKTRGYEDAQRCLMPIIPTFNTLKHQRQSLDGLINSTERLFNDSDL